MPSDIRTDSSRSRLELPLSTLIVSIFVALVAVISIVLLVSGYQIARKAIETDVDRHRESTQQIAHLVVTSWLKDVRQLLELTAQESALRTAMAGGDIPELEAQLTGIYYSQEEGAIDILFAHLADSDRIVDVGGPQADTSEFLHLVHTNQAFALVDRVVVLGEGRNRRFAVLSRTDVVEPVTGRVLGAVYGGIAVDNNVSLLAAVSRAAGATSVAIEIDGQLTRPYLAPGSSVHDPERAFDAAASGGRNVYRSDLPLTGPDGQALVLVSSHSLQAVAELGRNYRTVLIAVATTILILSLIGVWLLRVVIRKASASLTGYVDDVNRSGHHARFRKSFVREFNEVGAALSRSVEALQESEQRALAILNNAAASISIKSRDGVYTFVNHEFELSMGREAADVLGRRSVDILPPSVAETVDRSDQTVIKERRHVQFESALEVDGAYRAAMVTKFPLLDVAGEVTGVCSIASDITTLKLSEKALTEALAAAESASQAKSRFLATMSHEFRTPLNAILGFSELIRGQYLGAVGNETYLGYAEDIHKSGRQMLDLVDEILDSAAIEAGHRQFDHKPVDLTAVIAEAVKQFEHRADEREIALEVSAAGDLPEIVSDYRAILQVLQNLLSNAVKFTRPGGRIIIAANCDGDGVELQVSDTGIGMSSEVVENVTEPFFQDKSDPHLAEAGTGLGLSIVKAIVEAIGGSLKIDSEPAKGTRVTVHLPAGGDRGGDAR